MGMTGAPEVLPGRAPAGAAAGDEGVRLALVQVWATATIAALVAGPGLGRVITDGFFRTNYGKGIAGAVVVGAGGPGPRAPGRQCPAAGRPRRVTDRHPNVISTVGGAVYGCRGCRRRRRQRGSSPAYPDTRGNPATGHRRNTMSIRRLSPRCSPSAPSSSPPAVRVTTSTPARRRRATAPSSPRPSPTRPAPAARPICRPELPRGDAGRRRCTSSSSRTPATRSTPSWSTPATATWPTFPGDVDIVPEYVGGIVNFLNTAKNGDNATPFEAGDGERARRGRQGAARRGRDHPARPVRGDRHQRLLRDQGVLRGQRRHQALRPRGRERHAAAAARLRGPRSTARADCPTSTASTSPRCCRSATPATRPTSR